MQDIYDFIQEVNRRNAIKLQVDYDFDWETKNYIFHSYWPIITIHNKSVKDIEILLENNKKEFIEKYDEFDISIYKREYLDIFIWDLELYIRGLEGGRFIGAGIENNKNDDLFYRFKDPTYIWQTDTLMISTKNLIELEIYFKNILDCINNFIKDNDENSLKSIDGKTNRGRESNKPKTESHLTIKQKVEKAFKFMQGQDMRNHKQILNENDYNNLIDWVTYYFENNFEIPKIIKPIQKINTIKGNVICTFKIYFKSEYPSSNYPENLFELYKACFYNYRNDKKDNFLKQKEPQYYYKTINNTN